MFCLFRTKNITVQIFSLLVIGLPIKIFSRIAHHDSFKQAQHLLYSGLGNEGKYKVRARDGSVVVQESMNAHNITVAR